MSALDVPVEIAGYVSRRLPTYDSATGEIAQRWWSVKRGIMPMDFNHFICSLLKGADGRI